MRTLNPTQLIVLTFVVASVLGGILLKLPLSTHGGISFIDALFTSTSAVCVTGLIVVDTGAVFTQFGKTVILLLIQTGGLGIATYGAVFASVLTGRMSLRERAMMRQSFAHHGMTDLGKLVLEIIIFTFAVELIAATFFYLLIPDDGFFTALFHAVSAFCNAGFSFYSDSFVGFRGNVGVNLLLSSLIILGGIGFLAIHDIRRYVLRKTLRIPLHTKVVLIFTAVLLIGGTAAILGLEWNNSLQDMALKDKMLASFFQSVTTRTAGFNTVDLTLFSSSTIFILIVLMFIGASPGSCAGGIKTSTLAVLLSFVRNRSVGRTETFLFKRTVPQNLVSKAATIATVSLLVVIVMTIILVAHQGWGSTFTKTPSIFTEGLFEIVSAFGTVGLSLGLTSDLSTFGKIVVILTMLIGRVGPLAIALAVEGEKPVKYKYAEERMMLG